MKKDLAFINQKGARRSFLDEAEYRGSSSPSHYNKSFTYVDAKIKTPAYKQKIKPDYDVATFLKNNVATKNVSPTIYNTLDSFNKTQSTSFKFKMLGRDKSI